jgi:hypothetical protein
MCAQDFRGSTLFPLANLRKAHPDLYERERAKYAGREAVLRFVVPGLGATWGETVNLSALNPLLLVKERRRLGIPYSNLLSRRILCIPIDRLSGHLCVAYTATVHWANSAPHDPLAATEPPVSDSKPFDASAHSEPTGVPARHTKYLLHQRSRGEFALGFVFVPHVLVAAPIDISGLHLEPPLEA